MPTILRIGPYRLFFYANEGDEPRHVHIQHERRLAKFWLDPPALASSTGFSARDLHKMLGLVETHRKVLSENWNEFFAR
ncbi:MAG TPA: DUF4160 domain-containing protein [Rhodanobacteraceae bacterium]|jgi:hypothetical protein|nr:DUF4160 domain-containing protein [Rhodanobacteraceae bacterium]